MSDDRIDQKAGDQATQIGKVLGNLVIHNPVPTISVVVLVAAVVVIAIAQVWGPMQGMFSKPPTPTSTQRPTAIPTRTLTQRPTAIPTRTPTQRPTATPTRTPTPVYQSGLITYISIDENQKSLYAVRPDGTSTLLLQGADVEVLAVSPDQSYLAVAVSRDVERGIRTYSRLVESSVISLLLVSADGQVLNELVSNVGGVNAAFLDNERLIIASMPKDSTTVTYTVTSLDGSSQTQLYFSDNVLPTKETAPEEIVTEEPVDTER